MIRHIIYTNPSLPSFSWISFQFHSFICYIRRSQFSNFPCFFLFYVLFMTSPMRFPSINKFFPFVRVFFWWKFVLLFSFLGIFFIHCTSNLFSDRFILFFFVYILRSKEWVSEWEKENECLKNINNIIAYYSDFHLSSLSAPYKLYFFKLTILIWVFLLQTHQL